MIVTPSRGNVNTLTSFPDRSITVLRLWSTLRLLSRVLASLMRLMSSVTAVGRNGARIFALKSRDYSSSSLISWSVVE